MKGWFLYVGELAADIQLSLRAAEKSGVLLEIVDPKDVDLILEPDATQVFLRGVPVSIPDFAVAAFLDHMDHYNLAVLRHLELLGTLCVNTEAVLLNCHDKMKTHHILAAANIPTPRTALLHRGMTSADVLRHLDLPLVLKLVTGQKGENVELIEDPAALDQRLAQYRESPIDEEWLAQEFIHRSSGHDVRVVVIDGKAAVSIHRQGPKGSFKSNVSLGGTASPWPLTDELRELSNRVSDALGLNVGGIDILLNGDEFLVSEVNAIPALHAFESATELNMHEAIMRSIHKQLMIKPKSRFQMRADSGIHR